MIKLNENRVLQAILAGAVATTQPVAVVSYNDKGEGFDGETQLADLNGATAVDICDAPAADEIRHIDYITIRNFDSAQVVLTVRVKEGATIHKVIEATLEAGEMLGYTHSNGWYVNAADGSRKSGSVQDLSSYATSSEVAAGYQPLDTDLTILAALAPNNDDVIQRKAGAWTARSPAQLKTDLNLSGTNTGDQDLSGYATTSAMTTADATVLSTAQAYADSLVVGLVDDRGNFDASGNTFPTTGGSGSAGAILKGDLWTVSVAGTLGGHPVTAGDLLRALVDSPGSTDSNWAITENNIGYVAEPAQTAASQAEAEAGSGSSIRSWTPQRIWQAIAAKLTLGTWISGATAKGTPVDADTIALSDSAASNGLVKVTLTAFKAFLKTYFDTLYAIKGAITGSALTMATGKLLGRSTASTGAIEEITVGSGLSLSGGTLSTSGGSGATLGANTFTDTQTMPRIVGTSNVLQVGPDDAATPTAQTVAAQSVVAGTSNTAGADFTVTGSLPTGTGAAGNVVVKTAFKGLSGNATVTISIASPAVITWTNHLAVPGQAIRFTTTGALPTGITAGVTYYVMRTGLSNNHNQFQISATPTGSAVNTSGSQSGTHTGTWATDVQNPASTVATFGPAGLTGSTVTAALELSTVWQHASGLPRGFSFVNYNVNSGTGYPFYFGDTTTGSDVRKFSVDSTGSIYSANQIVAVQLVEADGLGYYLRSNSGVYRFGASDDGGFSRLGAASLALGNGSNGDFSGTLKLTNLNAVGNLATGTVSKTANFTATTSNGTIECDATSGAITITGFACSGNAGKILVIKKTDSSGNAVTFDPNASEQVDGSTTHVLSAQYATGIYQVNAAGTAWNRLGGI